MAAQGSHWPRDEGPTRLLSEESWSSVSGMSGGTRSVCMLPTVVDKTLYFTYHLPAIRMPWVAVAFPLLHAYVYQSGSLSSTKREKHFPF